MAGKTTDPRADLARAAVAVWGSYMRKAYGSPLPKDYMTFDCETTAAGSQSPFILELGYCVVRGGRATYRGGAVINWTLDPAVDEDEFWYAVDEVCDIMRDKADWRLDRTFIQEHGKSPAAVLRSYVRMFSRNRRENGFFVGHNAWSYDVPLLESAIAECTDCPDFRFGDMEVLDTGGMEKAVQLGKMPHADETLKDYFLRINRIYARGVKWSLETCLKRYKLVTRFGLDTTHAHRASFDAYCCHLVYEQHRQLAGISE